MLARYVDLTKQVVHTADRTGEGVREFGGQIAEPNPRKRPCDPGSIPAASTKPNLVQSFLEWGNQRSFLSDRLSSKPGLDSAPKKPMTREMRTSNTSAVGK